MLFSVISPRWLVYWLQKYSRYERLFIILVISMSLFVFSLQEYGHSKQILAEERLSFQSTIDNLKSCLKLAK